MTTVTKTSEMLARLGIRDGNPGNYAIVVFKTGSGDATKSGSYRLEISTTTTDTEADAPPVRTRIVSATPSPFRSDVRLGFDLAQGGEVRLEVLDVTGARRRVLAGGHASTLKVMRMQ